MRKPKSSTSVEFRRTRGGCRVTVSGVIDESFQPESLVANASGVTVFDVGGVRQIMSFGIRQWVTALRQLTCDYYCFINCPPPFVAQLTMVSGFSGSGEVVSFQLPYLCPECGAASRSVLDLRRPEHCDVVASLTPPEMICAQCGALAEFDDFPDLYFQYFQTTPLPNPPELARAIIDGKETRRSFHISKQPSERVTGLWMTGTLDHSGYFKRLADGLQGHIVVVLSEVDDATPSGVAGLVKFLATPELEFHLARVAPVALDALARHRDQLNVNLVSVSVPCHCSRCDKTVTVEVPAAALARWQVGAAEESPCPICRRPAQPIDPETWLPAALQLPAGDPGPEVARYLEGGAAESSPPAAHLDDLHLMVQKLAGKYQIQRKIGSGGMGDIYLAKQLGPGGFEKRVVIKRIAPERFDDQKAIELFLQEARLSASLSHPNIVQIFDLIKNGPEYLLIMEYVDGLDLHNLILTCRKLRRAIPVRICCRIICDLCEALHAAHSHCDEAGVPSPIIHRDVSPGNVLISSDGLAKLADFGIAKGAGTSVETAPGVVKGTVRFIPPEIVRSSTRHMVHPRIDVYGAGVLLFECLTGRHMFVARDWTSTLVKIVSGPIPNPAKMRRGVSERLALAFRRAVAKDPQKRYQTVRELRDEVRLAAAELGPPVSNEALASWLRAVIAARDKSAQDTTAEMRRAEAKTMSLSSPVVGQEPGEPE